MTQGEGQEKEFFWVQEAVHVVSYFFLYYHCIITMFSFSLSN